MLLHKCVVQKGNFRPLQKKKAFPKLKQSKNMAQVIHFHVIPPAFYDPMFWINPIQLRGEPPPRFLQLRVPSVPKVPSVRAWACNTRILLTPYFD